MQSWLLLPDGSRLHASPTSYKDFPSFAGPPLGTTERTPPTATDRVGMVADEAVEVVVGCCEGGVGSGWAPTGVPVSRGVGMTLTGALVRGCGVPCRLVAVGAGWMSGRMVVMVGWCVVVPV